MEGPYLNKELKGAMNEGYLWKPPLKDGINCGMLQEVILNL
jgi:N-acetylglucosamine-6-phosphate deacetylase